MEGNMVSVQIAALIAALSAGGETALLDFHAPWCAPCRAMDGVIANLERGGYPIRKINVDSDRHLSQQFNVKTVPCFVLVVDGKEAGRITGPARRDELEAMFARAGVERGRLGSEATRAQSPDSPATHPASGVARAVETSARGPAPTSQDMIDASVRLTIADPQGFSYGSGTLIDARQGEALVLTCGHIFRDSQGQGQISVDLCAPGGPQKLPGRLVSYDLENDVALVSIRPGVPVRVAPLAPKGYQASTGDRVVTVGCNNGGSATARESTITAINKFLAAPNLSVAGLPAQGRSGGGLFTADGQVIGVCNAADPADNEGLFAALAIIHDELGEAGLAAILQDSPLRNAATLAADLEQMPGPADSQLAADRGVQAMPANIGALANIEPATLAQVRNRADGAEVICIIRPLANPQSKSEVIMLDRASSAFLEQLAADREAQEARHLTSLKVRSKAPAIPRRSR
jgi:thiol-disulfide isomerase/thioredoxin